MAGGFSAGLIAGVAKGAFGTQQKKQQQAMERRKLVAERLEKIAQDENWPEEARSQAAQSVFQILTNPKLKDKDLDSLGSQVLAASSRPNPERQQLEAQHSAIGEAMNPLAALATSPLAGSGIAPALELLRDTHAQAGQNVVQAAPETVQGPYGRNENLQFELDKAQRVAAIKAEMSARGTKVVPGGYLMPDPEGGPPIFVPTVQPKAENPSDFKEGFVQPRIEEFVATNGRQPNARETAQIWAQARADHAAAGRAPVDPNVAAMRQESLDLRRQMFEFQQEQRAIQHDENLARQYNTVMRPFNELTIQMANMIAGHQAQARDPKARNAADVALLYGFIKVMDPSTAVREGEIDLVRSAASYRSNAENWLRKFTNTSQVLSDQDREMYMQMARHRFDVAKALYEPDWLRFRRLAANPDRVVQQDLYAPLKAVGVQFAPTGQKPPAAAPKRAPGGSVTVAAPPPQVAAPTPTPGSTPGRRQQYAVGTKVRVNGRVGTVVGYNAQTGKPKIKYDSAPGQ